MALIKTITTPHGVECKYHRVLIAGMDEPNYIEIRLASYINEEKRRADCPPVWYQIYQVDMNQDSVEAEDKGKSLNNTIKSITYRKLKQTEMWADAEDD